MSVMHTFYTIIFTIFLGQCLGEVPVSDDHRGEDEQSSFLKERLDKIENLRNAATAMKSLKSTTFMHIGKEVMELRDIILKNKDDLKHVAVLVVPMDDEEEQGEKDSESDSIKAVIQKAAMEEPEIKPDLKGLTWSEKQDGIMGAMATDERISYDEEQENEMKHAISKYKDARKQILKELHDREKKANLARLKS